MEVEPGESREPFSALPEYGDNGELDLDYGELMEQELETTPLHPEPAAFEEPLLPRLVAQTTTSSHSREGICSDQTRSTLREQPDNTLRCTSSALAALGMPPCHTNAFKKCCNMTLQSGDMTGGQDIQQQQLQAASA